MTGGLAKFDDPAWHIFNTSNSGLPVNNVTSIAIDIDSTIWIGTRDGGLVSFYNTTWTVFDTSNSPLPSNIINSVSVDKLGNKWIDRRNPIGDRAKTQVHYTRSTKECQVVTLAGQRGKRPGVCGDFAAYPRSNGVTPPVPFPVPRLGNTSVAMALETAYLRDMGTDTGRI